jgi:hypothetical protein
MKRHDVFGLHQVCTRNVLWQPGWAQCGGVMGRNTIWNFHEHQEGLEPAQCTNHCVVRQGFPGLVTRGMNIQCDRQLGAGGQVLMYSPLARSSFRKHYAIHLLIPLVVLVYVAVPYQLVHFNVFRHWLISWKSFSLAQQPNENKTSNAQDTGDKHPFSRRDSNPQSQQAIGRRSLP